MYETPVKQLTDEQLRTHYDDLLNRQNAVIREQDRRRSLPYIWDNETTQVKLLRDVLPQAAPEVGAAWVKPSSIVSAYIEGDTVTHLDQPWIAVGLGAIMHEPGTADPVMGERWDLVEADAEGA